MPSWPDLGTRVTVRYRRPAGSVPPLTDAVGHLLSVDPRVRVETKAGTVVEFAAADVVAVRVLTETPVRTSQIRAVEHAAALGWPGSEHHWLDGWLLRAGNGITPSTNSAVPLEVSAHTGAIPEIVAWYTQRNLTPLLACPDRLLRLPGAPVRTDRVLLRDLESGGVPDPAVTLTARPDDVWLRLYGRGEPVDVPTAVIGGEVIFGTYAGGAAARAAVTDAADGSRWVGLSAVQATHATNAPQAANNTRVLCETLLNWGAARGASRGYVRVPDDDTAAGLFESLGFTLHHRSRYLPAAPVLNTLFGA